MKKLLKGFSWSAFLAYAITFAIVAIPVEWIFGTFSQPNFNFTKFVEAHLLKAVLFGLLLDIVFGKQIEKTESE